MAFLTYPTIPDPWPDRAQGQAAFDAAVSGTFTFFAELETWAGAWQTEAESLQAALVAGNLPSLTGQAGRTLIVNGDEDSPTFGPQLVMLGAQRNKIINGQFTVNQRGAASYTATGYTLDRWRLSNGAGAANTVTREAFALGQTDVPGEPEFYLRWARGTAGTAESFIEQRIEDVRTLAGRTVTATFWARATASTVMNAQAFQVFGTGGSPSTAVSVGSFTDANLTTAWQKFSATLAIPSISGKTLGTNGDDYLVFRLRRAHNAANPTATVEVANVSLVEGNATGEADPGAWRDETVERLLAARYYWSGGSGLTAGTDNFRVYSGDLTGVNVSALIPYIVPMRAAPTVGITTVQGTGLTSVVRRWGVEVYGLSAGSSPERRIEFTLDSVDAEL